MHSTTVPAAGFSLSRLSRLSRPVFLWVFQDSKLLCAELWPKLCCRPSGSLLPLGRYTTRQSGAHSSFESSRELYMNHRKESEIRSPGLLISLSSSFLMSLSSSCSALGTSLRSDALASEQSSRSGESPENSVQCCEAETAGPARCETPRP